MEQGETSTTGSSDNSIPTENPVAVDSVAADAARAADMPRVSEVPQTTDTTMPANVTGLVNLVSSNSSVPADNAETSGNLAAANTKAANSVEPAVILRSSGNTQERQKQKLSRSTRSMPLTGTPYRYLPENCTLSEKRLKSSLKRRTVCGATPVADNLEEEFKALSLGKDPNALQDTCFQIIVKGKLAKSACGKAVSGKNLDHSEGGSAGASNGDTDSTGGEGKEDILQILLNNFHGQGREHFQSLVPQISVIPDVVEYKAHESYDVRLDNLILQNQEEKSCMWVPQNAYSIDFTQDDYEENYFISHIVHIDEYREMRKAKSLLPKPIEAEMDSTSLRGMNGAWFRTRPPHGHSKYGCASLDITLHRLVVYYLLTGRFRMYLAEVFQSPTRCVSRLVMVKKTDQDIPGIWAGFELYNPGGPWFVVKDMAEGSISHKFPRFIRAFCSRERHPVEHEVEVFFKFDEGFFKKVFTRMDMLPVSHVLANGGEEGMCQKYRSGDRATWVLCPSPLSVTESYLEMGDIDEEFWD
ncbi:uncharacterized protein [Macrobrachium rosenbergii]|uniref:uncharacterized protein isoform X1 n=1 Tax=Macrobrachium rosenbergii TaxID=79674 RepID=UPI0034D591FB